MEVKACIFTDAGKVRKINQDAAMIKVANTKRYGRISFACVCDGMGGLQKGEIASCKAIRALENWFMEELALMQNMDEQELWNTVERSLRRLLVKVNADIRRYGKHRGIRLGTTLTALLQIGNRYLTMNVGDSRIYLVDRKEAVAITKDQSLVRQKLDEGLITRKEADSDPERNILLQSLGTGQEVIPEIERGELWGDTTVVVCSDGFWRTLKEEDIHGRLCPQMCVTPDDMLQECRKLAELAFERREEDNISVAVLSFVG